MRNLDLFLLPYIISQCVALFILLLAWKKTHWGRMVFAMLFMYAGIYNMYIGFEKPDDYLGFADYALPFYRDFINGWFKHNNHIAIPIIATGQLMVATGMLLRGWWVKWACIGAIVFLISIIPLMVGSAFPFPIIVSFAAWLILKRDDREYLWKKSGVKTQHNATGQA